VNQTLLLIDRLLFRPITIAFSFCTLVLGLGRNISRSRAVVKLLMTQLHITILIFAVSSISIANETLRIQDKIIPIGSEYQNSIQILNNRFRIDADVKEVTIVFFREFGSPPIVLVRPDGSKLYLENDLEDDSFNWFETDTYDMISLSEPMPGPWQAIGDVLPDSRIMVIAGITLHADPIPATIFSGETIKQTAYLENAGSRIDMSGFRDVVTLSIEFVSTNNPDYPNFGLGSRPIARFEDNGLGFDEYEADGTFTGQFDLKITEGEYKPIFTVRTPLFSREQISENIVLLPSPINVSHILEGNDRGDHVLNVGVNTEYLKASDFVVDGSVRHPNGEIANFSLTEATMGERSLDILNSDYGIYKVNMSVFAQTLDGRDLVLSVPEYSFVTSAPEIIVEATPAPETELEDVAIQLQIQEPEDESQSYLIPAIIINIILLIIGILVILLVVNKRKHPNNHYMLRVKQKIEQLKKKQPEIKSQDANA
jgi:uncharacterized protein (TIGR03503 family)